MKTLFSTIVLAVLAINAHANPLLDAMTPSYAKSTEQFAAPKTEYIKYDLGPIVQIPKNWKLISVTTDKGGQFLWFQDNIGAVHMMYGVFDKDSKTFVILQNHLEEYTIQTTR